VSPHDEVEQRAGASAQNEADYPDHQLPPWFAEDDTPRSLEPIVRVTQRAAPKLPLQGDAGPQCLMHRAIRRGLHRTKDRRNA
jgi:hypothetical protein